MVELQMHPIPYPPELLGPRAAGYQIREDRSAGIGTRSLPLMNLGWLFGS